MKKKITEKAKSKSQQRLMGMALAYKRGDKELSEFPESAKDEIKDLAKSMSEKELEKFASTKHKSKKGKELPEKIDESIDGHYMNTLNIDKIFEYSKWLKDNIPQDAPLYNWMESHLAQAADNISEIKHKIEHKMKEKGMLDEDLSVSPSGELEGDEILNFKDGDVGLKTTRDEYVDKELFKDIVSRLFKEMRYHDFIMAQKYSDRSSMTYYFMKSSFDEEQQKKIRDVIVINFGLLKDDFMGIRMKYIKGKNDTNSTKELFEYETNNVKQILEFLLTDFELDEIFDLR